MALGLVAVLVLLIAAVVLTRGNDTRRGAAIQPGIRYQDEVFPDLDTERNAIYDLATPPGAPAGTAPTPLTADVYQPKGDPATSRPAVVWIHGGGLFTGDKAKGPVADLAPAFAKRGFVSVSINYRLTAPRSCAATGGRTPDCFAAALVAADDAKSAVRWVRQEAGRFGVDPNRIAVAGESAGGIVATGLGIAPPSAGGGGNQGPSSQVEAWMSFSGGLWKPDWADRADPPGLLIHGDKDSLVPYEYSAETAAAMRRVGAPVELVTLRGADHVPYGQYRSEIIARTAAFFVRYLRLNETGAPGG